MIDKKQKYYGRIKSYLIGKRIKEVFYEELDYKTELEYWEYANEIHSIDMNIIFQFDDGKIIQIKWDPEFYSYGIGFESLKEITKREGFKIIRVTENSNWKKLIGKEITVINVLWDVSEGIATEYYKNRIVKEERIIAKLPLSWQIEFENLKIWISAFEIRDGETDILWADNLTVFFTEKAQEKYELINNASMQCHIISK